MTIPPNYQDIAVYTPAAAQAIIDAAANDPYKEAVRVATAAPLPSNSRSGNVLTASSNGLLNNTGIDGKTDLALNQRVLVKDEVTGANNGLYYITSLGGASSKWTLTRATDADASAAVKSGMSVYVSEGTTNAGTEWTLTTADPITLNTTALTFANKASTVSNATTGAVGVVQLAGDLGGTATSPSVLKLRGTSIATAGGALTTGQVPRVTGPSTIDYGALDLANSSAVTGVLPGANVFNEATVTITQAADLAGLGAGVQTFDKDLSPVLPANARVLGAVAESVTDFDDATHGTYAVTLGSSAGGTQVGTSLNVAAGQTGFPKAFSAGAQGYMWAGQGGNTLSARIASSVDLNTATTGAITIKVFYVVLA